MMKIYGYMNREKLCSLKDEKNNSFLLKPQRLKSKRIYNINDTKGLQIINCEYLYKRKTRKNDNKRKRHMNSVTSLVENVDLNELNTII